MKAENTLSMSAPWVIFYKKVKAIFEKDPDVEVKYDDENTDVRIYVSGSAKADAISLILPAEMTFGTVRLTVSVIPANTRESLADLFRDAFEGNPVVSGIVRGGDPVHALTHVQFSSEPLQFFADNIQDANGNVTMLAEDIAKDIFVEDRDGVMFGTEPVRAE